MLAFCNFHLNLKDSDEAHQEFATFYLKHLRFLYEKSDGNDSEVSTLFYLMYEVYAQDIMISQKFTGAFRGSFILQTFAAHLTTIKGAHYLSSINNHDTTPCGGLALCAAAVSIAIETCVAFSCLK